MKAFYDQVYDLEKEKTLAGVYRVMWRFPTNTYAEYIDADGAIVRLSYEWYRAHIERFAAALHALLAQDEAAPDGFIGIKLANSPLWGCCFWAALQNGLCPVLIDGGAEPALTERILAEAGASIIISENAAEPAQRVITPAMLESAPAKSGFAPHWADRAAFCSSGTQRMKLCVYSGEAIANQIISAIKMPEDTDDIMYPSRRGALNNLALLPFHHIFGFVAVFLWYTFFGRTIVFIPDIRPDTIFSACRRLKVSHIFAVPMLFNGIAARVRQMAGERGAAGKTAARLLAFSDARIKDPARAGKNPLGPLARRRLHGRLFGGGVRFMIAGGSYISPATLSLINAMGYPLYNGYGLTEAGVTSVELARDEAARIEGGVGKPLYGVTYTIDGGADEGELLIESGFLHFAVLEKGALVPRADTPLHTGDYAKKCGERFFITGRKKDMILNAAGENISPDELEESFPAEALSARRLCIIGLLRPGESAEKTALVIEPASPADGDALRTARAKVEEINRTLPLFKRIDEVYIAKEPLPETPYHKIRRGLLKSRLLERPQDFPRLAHMEGALAFAVVAPRSATTAQMCALMEKCLSRPTGSIAADDHFVYDLAGDSFAYAELINDIEQHFDVTIPPHMFAKCATAREFAALIDNLAYCDAACAAPQLMRDHSKE